MDRNACAAEALEGLDGVRSVLDVGCRDGGLQDVLAQDVAYFGSDLHALGDHVRYVGDFSNVSFARRFTTVVALDVLEHMDAPSQAFDKMAALAERHIVASLPNCYDLKSRWRFLVHGRLGGKYVFGLDDAGDRHRWVVGYHEALRFFEAKAARHGFRFAPRPLRYGRARSANLRTMTGRGLSAVLPPTWSVETVMGVFVRP